MKNDNFSLHFDDLCLIDIKKQPPSQAVVKHWNQKIYICKPSQMYVVNSNIQNMVEK